MNRASYWTTGIATVFAAVAAGAVQAQVLSSDEQSPVGLAEDRDLLPEQEGSDLQGQVNVGTVEDEQVLAGEEEGQLRGAGVGLREDESGIGDAQQLPSFGLERDE